MKKLIALMFLGLMAVGILSGCAKEEASAPTATEETTEEAPAAE